jgi:hypothetical protein
MPVDPAMAARSARRASGSLEKTAPKEFLRPPIDSQGGISMMPSAKCRHAQSRYLPRLRLGFLLCPVAQLL